MLIKSHRLVVIMRQIQEHRNQLAATESQSVTNKCIHCSISSSNKQSLTIFQGTAASPATSSHTNLVDTDHLEGVFAERSQACHIIAGGWRLQYEAINTWQVLAGGVEDEGWRRAAYWRVHRHHYHPQLISDDNTCTNTHNLSFLYTLHWLHTHNSMSQTRSTQAGQIHVIHYSPDFALAYELLQKVKHLFCLPIYVFHS